MSACHFSDGRCIGQERFDPGFDPNTLEAQLAIKVSHEGVFLKFFKMSSCRPCERVLETAMVLFDRKYLWF